MRTALYRHFAADGRLLYVGISLNSIQRTMQHRLGARWFELIARIEVEWLDSRSAAETAERAAIASERPEFNTIRYLSCVSPSIRQTKPERRIGEAVLHVKSGRIDGWYYDGSGHHMAGWFRAMFPLDRFEVLTCPVGFERHDPPNKWLRWVDWSDWAASEPDHSAADAFGARSFGGLA